VDRIAQFVVRVGDSCGEGLFALGRVADRSIRAIAIGTHPTIREPPADRALIRGGREDGHLAEVLEVVGKRPEARGVDPVVVG
jgi:hypothetical protein